MNQSTLDNLTQFAPLITTLKQSIEALDRRTEALERRTQALLDADQNIQNLIEALKPSTPSSSPVSEYFSSEELSKYLGCSVKNIYLMTSKKAKNQWPIKTYRCGRKLRFSKAEVKDCIKNGKIALRKKRAKSNV